MYLSPYAEGEEAFRAGKTLDANPYDEGTDDALDWEDGWNDAECESGS